MIWRYISESLDYFTRFDRNAWLVAFAVVVVVGSLCMRGFGSRKTF